MRYISCIGEQMFQIEIEDRVGSWRVFVNGAPYDIDLHGIDTNGLYSMLVNCRPYEAFVEEAKDGYLVTIQGEPFEVSVESERERRLPRKPAHPTGELSIKSPLPGMVLSVLAHPGEPVKKGDPLAILEAMKMENEICAPRSGVVKEVKIIPGQNVEQGEALIILE